MSKTKYHCQICGREIKIDKRGRICHHGYRRMRGWSQSSSCMGAMSPPYEKDRTVIGALIERLRNAAERILGRLAVLREGNEKFLWRGNEIHPTDTMYPVALREEIRRQEHHHTEICGEIRQLTMRYLQWTERVEGWQRLYDKRIKEAYDRLLEGVIALSDRLRSGSLTKEEHDRIFQAMVEQEHEFRREALRHPDHEETDVSQQSSG